MDALILIISAVAGALFYFAIKAGSDVGIWVMGGALLILFIAVCVAAWKAMDDTGWRRKDE